MEEEKESPIVPPYYPAAFSFQVNVVGIQGTYEGNFQEVTGLNVKISTEPLQEGGENAYQHRLPKPPVYENLVLKRGMIFNSELIKWARAAVEDFTFTPKGVIVNLVDHLHTSPIATWEFTNAYPVALKVSDLKAQENAIVCETLELCYDYFKRTL